VSVVSIAIGLGIKHWRNSSHAGDEVLDAVKQCVQLLESEVADAEKAVDQSKEYHPHVTGDITNLDAPTLEILRELPGVDRVERLVTFARPTHRLIHVRDWHLVARDDYLASIQGGTQMTPDEADLRYKELCLQVAIVQREQLAMLRCLVRHHGLKRTLTEGATVQDMARYLQRMDSLRKVDDSLADLVKSRATMRKAVPNIDREIATMTAQHQRHLVELGAAGRLAVERLADVLPLEDDQVFEAGWLTSPNGTVKVDEAKMERRHEAQVKTAMASGPVAVFVLGASHDLTQAVERLGGGTTEYVRVTTKAVGCFTGGAR
jgi:hypothetical protein